MDANVGAAIFKKGASLEATTASLSNPRSSYDTYSYTVSKGVIIDISWKGLSFSNAHASCNVGIRNLWKLKSLSQLPERCALSPCQLHAVVKGETGDNDPSRC